MVNNIQFISIQEVLSRVARHPKLQDIDLEAGVQYLIDFIALMGLPNIYIDKQADIEITRFCGPLPCDLVSIIQVRDERTGVCMRSMTDSFNKASDHLPAGPTFKTQGRTLVTSFEKGKVRIAYKAIPVDKDELPMLPDDPLFIRALESFIKKERFGVLFDCGLLKGEVYAKAEQDYYWAKSRCKTAFLTPSLSDMESITGMMHRLIPSKHEFQAGFKGLGDRAVPKRY